jgi:exopolyphosphatase/guanosine-5'-triphosphate,3'-diphosphate pyrophosphatase
MKIAALDLGSNTFLALVAEVQGNSVNRIYRDETEVVRLGAGMDKTGAISAEALKRARSCLQRYQKILQSERPDAVVAVATSAARDATNRADFEKMAAECGFAVQTITGDLEAQTTYRGATFDVPTGHPAVIDVGGGSTEIIGKNASGQLVGCSVDVGTVRMTDRFFPSQPPTFDQIGRLQRYVTDQFARAKSRFPQDVQSVVAVAGTPTALSCLEQQMTYDEDRIHHSRLTVDQLETWILRLAPLTVEQREQLPGMPKGRADVIVAGACILASAARTLNVKEVVVSTKGVRYGLALDWQRFQA